MRFDTRAATVTNPNAPAGAAVPTAANLQLGMTVEVRGEINANTGTGTAATVVIASEFKGPIAAVNAGANTLTIFGRTVHVTPATIFIAAAGLAQLQPGNVVEVYGLPQPDGSLRATRIEFEAVSVAEFVRDYPNDRFHVEGLLTALAGTAPSRTFSVAGVPFNETPTTTVTGTLADNTEVTVSFAPIAGNPPFDAVAVRVESRSFAAGVGLAEVEGVVTNWDSAAGTFTLQGFPVRLGDGVVFEDGDRTNLIDGDRVEVYGNIVNGVLVAREVEFEYEDHRSPFEFAGRATCVATPCGNPSGSFTVRGITIEYDNTTRFVDGATRDNLNGLRVGVEARLVAGSNPNRFVAIRVASEE